MAEEMFSELTVATARVQALAHLGSSEEYTLAATLLAQVIERERAIAAWYAEERAPFTEVQKKLKERERLALGPWQDLRDVLQTAMRAYEAEAKAARRAALEAAMAQAASTHVPVRLPDLGFVGETIPKVAGLQSRDYWSAEVTNVGMLIVGAGIGVLLDIWDQTVAHAEVASPEACRIVKAFLEEWVRTHGTAPMEALVPNYTWLNAQARDQHAELALPGVRATKREEYARGRRRTAEDDDTPRG